MAFSLSGGGGRRRRGRGAGRTPMAEINVTPLVDVMLVLLIIFMVTAPLLKAGVPVELPDSRAKALSEERHQITVTVTVAAGGQIYIDDDPVAPGELADRLAGVQPGPEGKLPLVTLRADKAIDWGRAMAVMGELNRAGFTSISLVTTATGAEPASIGGSGKSE